MNKIELNPALKKELDTVLSIGAFTKQQCDSILVLVELAYYHGRLDEAVNKVESNKTT